MALSLSLNVPVMVGMIKVEISKSILAPQLQLLDMVMTVITEIIMIMMMRMMSIIKINDDVGRGG